MSNTNTHIKSLQPKDELDEYTIVRFINQGLSKTSHIYEANDNKAVKLFTLDGNDGYFKLRFDKFKNETQVLEILKDCENVINTDCSYRSNAKLNGNDVEAHYYTMELMDGDLQSAVMSGMDFKERIKSLIQVGNALRYCHEKDIFHRDLYTSNVLIKIEGGQYIYKVSDFGSAKRLGVPQVETYFMPMGHRGYTSPEGVVGLLGKDADKDMLASGDAYAYGLLLYEVLTGYQQSNLMHVLPAIAGLARSAGLFHNKFSKQERKNFLQTTAIPYLKLATVKNIETGDIICKDKTLNELNGLMKKMLAIDHNNRLYDFDMVVNKLSSLDLEP